MKVAAIVSEFNPFHNGHKYLVDYCRNSLKCDYVISIMSGDFVQRGLPAFMSKETRTKMALTCGVDAVFLLPTVYSTSAADLFAYSSVSLLNRLGIIDYLVFGSECGNIDLIKECALKLFVEGNIDSPQIKALIKEGNTFAKARTILFPEYSNLLSEPNNILGIEYCKALLRLQSSITPVTVTRKDLGYNSESLDTECYASAKAIRIKIKQDNVSAIKTHVPSELLPIYEEAKTLDFNNFSEEMFYSLLLHRNNLDDYYGISSDLAQKIRKNLSGYSDITTFADTLKSKDLTHSGITRGLTHILLNISNETSYYEEKLSELTHVRLLGIKESAKPLLSNIKEHTNIGIVTSIPDAKGDFSDFTEEIFDNDLFAFTLYDKVMSSKYTESFVPEYSKMFIKVK